MFDGISIPAVPGTQPTQKLQNAIPIYKIIYYKASSYVAGYLYYILYMRTEIQSQC